MRVVFLLLTLLAGALTMNEHVVADEKKDAPNPQKKESYTAKFRVRYWHASGKMFLDARNVPAFTSEFKGQTVIYTMPDGDNTTSPKGSELTDTDGVVWIVERVVKFSGAAGVPHHRNYVKRKEKDEPKKPE